MKKTNSRVKAEKIQKITGQSLVKINFQAQKLIQMGLVKDLCEAYDAMIEMLKK